MLILKRNKNEVVTIGNNIRVIVMQVGKGSVRLGFEAPPSMPVHREEAIEKERRKIVTNVKDTAIAIGAVAIEPSEPDKGLSPDGVNASAYPCHSCGKPECEDKRCCESKKSDPDALRAAAGI